MEYRYNTGFVFCILSLPPFITGIMAPDLRIILITIVSGFIVESQHIYLIKLKVKHAFCLTKLCQHFRQRSQVVAYIRRLQIYAVRLCQIHQNDEPLGDDGQADGQAGRRRGSRAASLATADLWSTPATALRTTATIVCPAACGQT